LLKNLFASSERAAHHFQYAVIVQTLQDLVRSQHCFRVIDRRLLKTRIDFLTRIAWRQM
jgi:hypothetical protein